MTHRTAVDRREQRALWMRLLLYPTHTLPTACAPVLVAAGLAVRDGVFAPLPLTLAFVGSWLIHVAGVLLDNHELLRRHADVPEHPELLQALHSGSLRLTQLRGAALACLVLAVAAGVQPLLVGGLPALVLGAVGVAASVGYAWGPRYARFGLADPVFLLMFGVVAVAGAYYVQAAAVKGLAWTELPREAFVLGLPVGCIVTAVLVVDDLRDREADARKGWRTTAVRFGVAGSRAEYVGLLAVAYALPAWFWLGSGFTPWVLLPWLTLPVAVGAARVVCTRQTTAELFSTTPRTSMLAMAFGLLLGVGAALS